MAGFQLSINGRFWVSTEAYGIALVLLNVGTWALFRWLYLGSLDNADLWNAQALLWQGLLLFDTLVVVGIYTLATWRLVEASVVERSDRYKPLVVTVTDLGHYAVRNIGPGPALNVYVVVPVGPYDPNVHRVGALGAGGHVIPPPQYFALQGAPVNHIVITEALRSRTWQWSASLNVVTPHGVAVRFADFVPERGHLTFDQFRARYFQTLHDQLQMFAAEIVPRSQ